MRALPARRACKYVYEYIVGAVFVHITVTLAANLRNFTQHTYTNYFRIRAQFYAHYVRSNNIVYLLVRLQLDETTIFANFQMTIGEGNAS